MKIAIASFITLLSLASTEKLNTKNSQYPGFPFTISNEIPRLEPLTFKMMLKGDSMGYTKVEYLYNDWLLTVRETTQVNMGQEFYETIESTLSLRDFRSVTTNIYLQIGKKNSAYQATWNKDSVRINNSNEGKYAFANNNNTIDRLLSFYFYPRVALNINDKSIGYEILYPMDTVVRHIDVTIDNDVNTFTYKPRGGANQNLILSNSMPREITRITFEELPWVYELIRKQ